MILSSIVITVGLMTYFGWFYNYMRVNNLSASANMLHNTSIASQNDLGRLTDEVIFNNFGANALYVINILTNQGK